jgi:hypothetical protein
MKADDVNRSNPPAAPPNRSLGGPTQPPVASEANTGWMSDQTTIP